MLDKKESFQDKIQLLIRALRVERFRFIVLQHNHGNVRRQVQNVVKENFPDRDFYTFDVSRIEPLSFFKNVFKKPKGIFFLERFEDLISDAVFARNFNQRRDRFSKFPIQFIAFLPAGKQYIHETIDALPDMWSLRNLVLDLHVEYTLTDSPAIQSREPSMRNSLGGKTILEKEKELKNLEGRIAKVKAENPSLAYTLFEQATELVKSLGQYERGLKLSEAWYDFVLKQKKQEEFSMSIVLKSKAHFLKELGEYESAKVLLQEAISELGDKAEEQDLMAYFNDLAIIHQAFRDYQRAKELLEKVTLSDEQNFGTNHPRTATSYSNLAMVYQDLGDYHGAKELSEKALQLDKQNFGTNHPNTAIRYSNLASIFQDLGDYQRAKELLEKALQSDEQNFDTSHPMTAIRYHNLSTVLIHLNKLSQALQYAQKAFTILKEALPKNHPNLKIVEKNLNDIKTKIAEDKSRS